jgi:hypothetical protein
MKNILFAFLFLSPPAFASGLVCEHTFYGAPFATVELTVGPGGKLGEGAKVTMYGRSHLESVAQQDALAGEKFHLWLSKGTANEVEMIVYDQEGLPSLLINHRVSMGNEVHGACRPSGF